MNTPFSPSASKAWKQLMVVWKKMETRVSLVFYATGLLLVCLYEVGMNKDAAAADQMSPNALLEFALAVLLSYRSVQHMLFMAPTSSLVVVHFWYPTMKPEIRPYLTCLGLTGLASSTAAPELSVHVAAIAAFVATAINQNPDVAQWTFKVFLSIHVFSALIMILHMYHICGQSTNRRASNQDSELLFEMMEDPLDADPNINIAISFRGIPADKIETLVKQIEKVFEKQQKGASIQTHARRTYRGRGELIEENHYGETESVLEEEAVDRLRKPVIKKTRIQRELGLMKMDIAHRRVI